MAYKTPGVYLEEISLFPASVAEVATAIPAFIGHTEKAIKNGEDLKNKPTRITSLLDYKESFGGDCTSVIEGKVDTTKKIAVEVKIRRFYMYESLRLFFDNGGGPCYIVSVGDYANLPGKAEIENGLAELAKYDEPTMILMPDAVCLEAEKLHPLQGLALAQCGKLGDRVAILDLPNDEVAKTAERFRDAIGINQLKYGAAYAPWIITAYDKTVPFNILENLKDQDGNKLDLKKLIPGDPDYSKLLDELQKGAAAPAPAAPDPNAAADVKTVGDKLKAFSDPDATLATHYEALNTALKAAADDDDGKAKLKAMIEFLRKVATGVIDWRTSLKGENLKKKLEAAAQKEMKPAVDGLVAMEKNTEVEALLGRTDDDVKADYGPDKYDELVGKWISQQPGDTKEDTKHYANDADGDPVPPKDQAIEIGKDLGMIFNGMQGFVAEVQKAADDEAAVAAPAAEPLSEQEKTRLQDTLYNRYPVIGDIVRQIKLELSKVPPGGAVAGVYALVDATRGVWKAPANVSLNQVLRPTERIDDAAQENLNVDVIGGKSINAIRAFTGRGTIVWGARTLTGNDNEWRYINVRRFFNMVEESVKKSTAWAVFEPNAAPLWIKVKGMIENYLIQKWREGALAGARPDDAFYVKVGLGETMTAQDILEGRLNVEIGMAVVRPAEFIVLKFSHIMQKS